jgi:hypothetical protein
MKAEGGRPKRYFAPGKPIPMDRLPWTLEDPPHAALRKAAYCSAAARDAPSSVAGTVPPVSRGTHGAGALSAKTPGGAPSAVWGAVPPVPVGTRTAGSRSCLEVTPQELTTGMCSV